MRRALLVVAVSALVILPAVPAAARNSFTFYGSGFGHGLGMSQYGAYGLARDGWSHRRILRHFYSGTAVRQDPRPPRNLRIGLTQDQSAVRLSAEAGKVTIRVGDPKSGQLVGSIPRGKTWTVRATRDGYRVLNSKGRRVGGQDWGGTARELFLTYAGARVRSPDAGAVYNRGLIEFNLYHCAGRGCEMRMILRISPQEYLYGLGEVPSSWPRAALRAQAVAARTYAFKKEASGQHRAGCNCALYDSSLDQVYVGWVKEGGSLGGRWVRSVRQTDDQIVEHSGEVISAFYTSSDGGHTEDNENVWGGTPLPYLRGVCDPGDFTAANPNRVWHVSYSAAKVTDRLHGYTGNIGRVTGFSDVERGVSGRIIRMRVQGGSGSSVITGTALRAGLGLRDDRVWVNRNKNVTGKIRATYDAANCRPGLPTTAEAKVPGGSRQRFESGAIYRNADAVTAWLRVRINDEYRGAGGAKGPLGLPTSREKRLTRVSGCAAGCSRMAFDHGRIYWKSAAGAHALWGRVLNEFLRRDGVQGPLGFPTSRVQKAADGSTSATFEHGSISCPPRGGGDCNVS
jgi:stage II sporulation protein D